MTKIPSGLIFQAHQKSREARSKSKCSALGLHFSLHIIIYDWLYKYHGFGPLEMAVLSCWDKIQWEIHIIAVGYSSLPEGRYRHFSWLQIFRNYVEIIRKYSQTSRMNFLQHWGDVIVEPTNWLSKRNTIVRANFYEDPNLYEDCHGSSGQWG